MKSLDVEAVQAFVLAADLQSFTRAAEALDTTQSAVSLKIKRLEDQLGRRLLERTRRTRTEELGRRHAAGQMRTYVVRPRSLTGTGPGR